MCICDQKTSVLYLASRNSSQKPVECLLLRFICHQRCLNSGNFWLPYGPGFHKSVYVRLVGATAKRKKPHKTVAAGKTVGEVLEEFHQQTEPEPEAIYSHVFITDHQPE